MSVASQVQTFGAIHVENQSNLTINQIVQISPSVVKARPFLAASPYRGLEAFDEAHSRLFFGRDAVIMELLQAVPQHSVLMVSGASGSGKSSVVGAGLLPQLRQGVRGFRSFKMKPGSSPFEWLKASLVHGGIDEQKAKFAATPQADTLVRIAALRPPTECWLLFIDQFEELFTLCERAEHRDAFLDGLLAVATQSPGQDQFKIVLTMRSDFFDRFDPYPAFLRQIRRGLQFVTSPTPDELRQCIEQPAAQHGVVFEDELVEQILSELKGQPGALPLLQYMLHLLWEQDKPGDDHTLNKSSYVAIGGVKGALRQHADAVYARKHEAPRSEAEQHLIRQVFLRLVEISGQGDSAPVVSRRRRLRLFSATEQELVRELVSEKLLISGAEQKKSEQDTPRFEEATVELAHESLLYAWPKLAEWIKEARHVLAIRNRLSHDAQEWQRLRSESPTDSSRAEEELWSGTRLQQALELRARGDFRTVLGELGAEEESFLNASEAVAEKRLHREREASEKIRQMLLDSYIDRGHQLLFQKKQPYPAALWLHRAYKEGSQNPALRHLLKSAMHYVDSTSVVLSGHRMNIRSASFSPDGKRIVTASSDRTARVWDADSGCELAALTGHADAVTRASFSPDGSRIVTASKDKTARVWSAATGVGIATLTGHTEDVECASYSPDGRRIVTASLDHTARVWDADSGELVATLAGHTAPVESACYSSDGSRIVTASADKTARIWDAATGRLLATLADHTASVRSASFSPDDSCIVTASWDHTARIWDADTGQLLVTLTGHTDAVRSASFSPDGQRIVTASSDQTARIWDTDSGAPLVTLTGHTNIIECASFSPDESSIVTASWDQTARLWDADTGQLLFMLMGDAEGVETASFSPDGRRILTTSQHPTARVWEPDGGRLLAEFSGHAQAVVSASYSPDGRRLVTASEDQTAQVWNAEDGELVVELTGHMSTVSSARFSPDCRRIVTASFDDTARTWDATTGRLLAEIASHADSVDSASYSPDGRRIVTASQDQTARVWDADTGRLLLELKGHDHSVRSASYSPDGRRIVTASLDNTARVWDAVTGQLLLELAGHTERVESASYSPDGLRIVTASWDKTIRVWDADSGRLLAELTGHTDFVTSASFSPDGRYIVSASADQTVRLWDVATGWLLAELTGHADSVESASFSPDGRRIITASKDMTARLWNLAPESRTPEQLGRVIRARSLVRFEPADGTVLIPCMPSPAAREASPAVGS